MDCNDECPDDPDKSAAGQCGCNVPDIDSDSDFVMDCNDGCPNDPNLTAPGPCGCNAPADGTFDYDDDGIINCKDKCPNKFSFSPDGCPDPNFDKGMGQGMDEDLLKSDPCLENYFQGNPIFILTGNQIENETDVNVNSPFDGRFIFKRFYNSRSEIDSSLGLGWTHNYNLTLEIIPPDTYQGICRDNCDFKTYDHLMNQYAGWTVIQQTQSIGEGFGTVSLCPNASCSPNGVIKTLTYCDNFQYECELDLPGRAIILDQTGFGHHFENTDTGLFNPLYGDNSHLIAENNFYIWHRADGSKAAFDSQTNLLRWVEDKFGNRREMIYTNGSSELTQVVDTAGGRSLHFTYTDGRIVSISLFTGDKDLGGMVSYSHDENGNLTTVTYPDGSGFRYAYEDSQKDPDSIIHLNNMTRKTNADGHFLSSWDYDVLDRCIENNTSDDRSVSINYDDMPKSVTVTDAYGASKVYRLDVINGKKRIVAVEGLNGCAHCSEKLVRIEYDDNANVTEKEYANGRIDRFAEFDRWGNARLVTRAAGTPEEQALTYAWHPNLDRPLSVSEASVLAAGVRQTVWDYDNDGNETANEAPTSKVYRIIESGYTLDGSGSLVPVTAVTRFSYDSHGQVVAIDGPQPGNADTTVFEYHPETGDLIRMTRPLSGSMTFSQYDAAGRPGLGTDENGNRTAYSYDVVGRPVVITRLWDNAATRVTYTAAGRPETVTLPDGNVLTYQYDPIFGRLTAITDGKGDRVTHGYDDQGHVIETAYSPAAGERTFWEGFDYAHPQRPGKLWKRLDADGKAYQYAYDGMGNLNQVTDPAGRITAYTFDALNQPTATIQPGGITTDLRYDSRGNLALVTDPGGNTTEYRVDDLGRTVQAVSPDSGTTGYAYDAAGNLMSRIDANLIITTYEYDAENRLTAVHYPDPTQDVVLTYDAGENGLGRLAGRSDAGGTYSYAYDPAGNIVAETHAIDGMTATTGYAYNAAGQVVQMTYPDGLTVNYQRDAAGNVIRVTSEYNEASVVLADGITHLPFGPLASMTLGNGLTVNRSYDQNYRLTGIQTAEVQELTYNRDVVGNVTAVDDGMNAMGGFSMGYDDLDRLISASGAVGHPHGKRNLWKGKKGDNASGSSYGNQEMRRGKKGPHNAFDTLWFDYDANGNRQTRTDDAGTELYQYTSDTNQLSLITNGEMIDVVSDAAGNTIMYGDLDLTYNAAGRISQVEADGKILGSYVYSADGRRVKKVVNKKTVIFHYDLDGRLIAESDRRRGFAKLYIYLEGAPLAMVELKDTHLAGKKGNQVKGSTGKKGKAAKRKQALKDVYYYHTDHLGTPQRITDRHGKLVWAANYLPFGQAVVTLNKVENNLRFPGQYEDVETGLHYNYWRYYDPALGRYLRTDPIGLEGGLNLYAYAYANPLNLIDPYGLEVPTPGGSDFWNPGAPGEGFTGGVYDFIRNYKDMRDANTIGADKYFHCMANCQAARRGPGGRDAAEGISETREWVDENIKGDPASACNADRAANNQGRSSNPNMSCKQACSSLRPPGLNPRY